jgi:hypothetical protein
VEVYVVAGRKRKWARHQPPQPAATDPVHVAGDNPEKRRKLANYMLRATMSLETKTYDARGGTDIHRSKMHMSLKRSRKC